MKTLFWIALNLSLLVLLVSLCLFIGDVGQVTVDSIRADKLSIRQDNKEVYRQWVQPDEVTQVNIYLWHVANEDAVLNGATPKMVEIGPFCYEKIVKKTDIRHGANGQIKYRNNQLFLKNKDPTRNCLDEKILITSFNVPFPLVMRTLENMNEVYQQLFLTMIPPEWKILVTKTASELLWGYEDPVLKILEPFLSGLSTYGHFIGSNNSISSEYLVENGADGETGAVKAWSGVNSLENIWIEGKELRGVDSSALAPIHHSIQDHIITLFFDTLCRPVNFRNTLEVEYIGPIKSLVFALDEGYLQRDDKYCSGTRYTGTLDLSTCTSFQNKKLSLPLVSSNPHFLDGESVLFSAISGMRPNQKYHKSKLFVDPQTGVVLKSEINMQTNIEFNRWALNRANITTTENLIAPIYWTQLSNQASSSYLNFLNSHPFSNFSLIAKWPSALLICGVLFNLFAWTIYCQFQKQNSLITEFRSNFGKGFLDRVDGSFFSSSKVEDLSSTKPEADLEVPNETGDAKDNMEQKPEV